ncbi:MAG: DUF3368 domain-containing protein [Bacteroidota bacterium]
MIVISDTSPLSNLLVIGKLDLLAQLFEKVCIPAVVWEEISRLETFGIDPSPIKRAPWILIEEVKDQALVQELRRELDPGEAAAIALAVELEIKTILIDEKPGRLIAQKYALTPTGVLGILLRAKELRLLQEIKPELDKLREKAGFYISDPLYDRIMELAGEMG